MTSQFDLASFIQTVVYEDENEQEEEEEMNEVIEPNRPVPPIVKQKISSRQLSFIGPRQGVLSNSKSLSFLPRLKFLSRPVDELIIQPHDNSTIRDSL
jgi:hypothetical protein